MYERYPFYLESEETDGLNAGLFAICYGPADVRWLLQEVERLRRELEGG